jgi:hypothetical protein
VKKEDYQMRVILAVLIQIFLLDAAFAQAWRDCIPGSIGAGGGQSIGPGGGQALDRDRSLGLDPDTLRPYPESEW